MKNSGASLFELDTLLGETRSARPGAARKHSAHKPARAKRPARRACAPYAPAPSRPAADVVTKSFDRGDPICCRHAVSYRRVAAPNTQGPASPAPLVEVAQQLSDEYDVEAFEEPAEEVPLRLTDTEEQESAAVSESSSLARAYAAPIDRTSSSEAVEQRAAGALSEELRAVEQDLAELAARTDTSATQTPREAASLDEESANSAPVAPTAQRSDGHAVFDQMAQGMGYATEFRLPAVKLSQVFSVLDKQLDAERDRGPATASPAHALDADTPAQAAEPTMPGSETLIQDLIAMPGAKPAATPALENSTPPEGDENK
jgi:hypothetical protein